MSHGIPSQRRVTAGRSKLRMGLHSYKHYLQI